MTVYYQLENMLVAGFKSQDEYDRYQALKRDYESETEDYSFSIREITNQLEIICQISENDFPDLEEGILTDITTTRGEKQNNLISITITGKLPY